MAAVRALVVLHLDRVRCHTVGLDCIFSTVQMLQAPQIYIEHPC